MKNLAAIHEAAHVVVAYLSKYHFLVKFINLTSDTNGETFVSLSNKKLINAGKKLNDSVLKEPELIEDAAIIFYAGFEAETLYCNNNAVEIDISFSRNDYNNINSLIKNSNSPLKTSKEKLISNTRIIIEDNWFAIEKIAEAILGSNNNILYAIDAIEILDNIYNKNSWE